jgi:Subtilase family
MFIMTWVDKWKRILHFFFHQGAEIRAAWAGDKNHEEKVLTGTSMAAPFVSGAISLYLQQDSLTSPAEIRKKLFSDAIVGVLDVDDSSRNSISSTSLFVNVQSMLVSPSPTVAMSVEPTPKASTFPSFKSSDTPTLVPSYSPTDLQTFWKVLSPSGSPTKAQSHLPTSTPITQEDKELMELMQILEGLNNYQQP